MSGGGEPCVIEDLFRIVEERLAERPQGSYTVELAERGVPFIARKFGEEAVEVVVAALSEGRERLAEEAMDAIYHLVVLLAVSGVSLEDLRRVFLERRMSGVGRNNG